MENKQIRPLTPTERQNATENYHLISKFLKLSKLDAEEFFDIVVFDFLLSVEIYLNNEALREKCNFEAVSYMYMKRAVYRHLREQKVQGYSLKEIAENSGLKPKRVYKQFGKIKNVVADVMENQRLYG